MRRERTRCGDWDITYLPTAVRGRCLYLYLVVDIWSRRIVGWRVHDRESADLAAVMIREVCAQQGVDHSDNGTAMRGSTMVATLQWLGIVPSFSRPHVSDDNAYAEALFRTLKYAPSYPGIFIQPDAACDWVAAFVAWYNGVHRHSGIRFVTPDQGHFGHERAILEKRDALYRRACARRPERWSGATRNWNPVGDLVLNRQRLPATEIA